MTAYYNEIDKYAAQWLRNLIVAGHIAPGDVDERSITEVQPDDLRGYTQCHFFAGIGGWSYALRLAGWPDDRPVWTGSCPCQPFSSAASGANTRQNDARHLWPVWRGLIAKCAPVVVFGEQVAAAGDWVDGVCNDLESMGYAFGAAVLPACSIGADHQRARVWFVGHAHGNSESGGTINAQTPWLHWRRRITPNLAGTNGLPTRVARLRAYGNAIVPQVAAAFIEAFDAA
jgi:DNA (cytosine-5)-methyltransferase 1